MTSFALALGGGGARGIAHIHVLEAIDELGVTPTRIVGSSIGAIVGAGYCAGLRGTDIRDYAVETFTLKRMVIGRLWRTRPSSLQEFFADGGVRIGQLNAERVLRVFLPSGLPQTFEELQIPLGVMATDFYARLECELDTGDLQSALAASAALPAVFRPVRRNGKVLVDGGIFNPLPFDRLKDHAGLTIAVDVNGGPEGDGTATPTQMEALVGASQLMMQSIIDTKVCMCPPDLLLRPPVACYRVMDFLKTGQILDETKAFKDEAKRAIDRLLSGNGTSEVAGRDIEAAQ